MFPINLAGLEATYTVAEIVEEVDWPQGETVTKTKGTLVVVNGSKVWSVGDVEFDFVDVMLEEGNVIPLNIEAKIPEPLALT